MQQCPYLYSCSPLPVSAARLQVQKTKRNGTLHASFGSLNCTMDALRTWLEVNHGAELPPAEDCTVLAGHAEATLAEAAAGVSTTLTPSGSAQVSSRWARGGGGASLVVGDLVGFLLPTLAKLSERLASVLISDELGELENVALAIFRTIRAAAMIREHAKVLLSEKGAIRLVGEVMMRLLSKGASLRGCYPNCTSPKGNSARLCFSFGTPSSQTHMPPFPTTALSLHQFNSKDSTTRPSCTLCACSRSCCPTKCRMVGG